MIKTYDCKLDLFETEVAIKKVKDFFERALAYELNLTRVSAPLYVRKSSGLNDDLSGVERPVKLILIGIEMKSIKLYIHLLNGKEWLLKDISSLYIQDYIQI